MGRTRGGRAKPALRALPLPAYLALGATLFALTALILHGLGRPLTCDCAALKIWEADATGPQTSQHLADWYSALHSVYGMLFFGVMWATSRHWPRGWMFLAAIVAAAGWEIAENTPFVIDRFGQGAAGNFYRGDSIPNALGDMGFMLAGFALASWLPGRWTIAAAAAIEIGVGLLIHDSLLIGALTLLAPDAVAGWLAL